MGIYIENKDDLEKLLEVVTKTGNLLIKNGAEVFRVEDTIERVCYACDGLDSVNVFVMTSSVFITITYEKKHYSFVLRERFPSTRFIKLDLVNDFSRRFCSTDMTLDEAIEELEKIEEVKVYPNIYRSLGAGVTSAFFAVMFGGSYMDFIAALFIGFIVFYVLSIETNIFIPVFITDMMSGFFSAGLAALMMIIGIGSNIDMIIIGTLMPYVPGVAITNAIRDILAGDYVSGVMTTAKAIFSAIAIAFGVGIVLAIYFGGTI